MRISIIEDDQLISQMYRMKLESEGYDVDIADNGMNGIEMVAQTKPDLIILDYSLPDIDGSAVLREVRRNGSAKTTPVIVLTNMDSEEVAKEAKERGITRSMVGIEKAVKDKDTKIFLIGNAPTALFKLLEEISKEGTEKPQLIAGVPVGFVGCPESKEALSDYDVPFIRTNGTKGGSTVAVAVLHGILYQMFERERY